MFSASYNTILRKLLSRFQATVVVVFGTGMLFYIGQFLPAILLVLVLSLMGRSESQIQSLLTGNIALQFLVILASGLLITYLAWRVLIRLNKSPKEFLMLNQFPGFFQILEVIITYAIYMLCFITASVLLSSFTPINTNQAQELGVANPDTNTGLIAIFAMLVIIPSVSEEVLFRGFLFKWLKRVNGTVVAYIIASVLFGIAHLEYGNLNWIAVIDTLIFSIFLIRISQKHQSLYSSILLHAIKNSVAFIAIYLL